MAVSRRKRNCSRRTCKSLVSERVQIFVPGVVLRTLSPNTNPNLDATYKSNYNPSLSHLNPRTHTNAHTHTHMHGTARKLCLSLFPNPENQTQSSELPRLIKPFLRSSVEATVKQYKNYLSSKLQSEHSIIVPSTEVCFVATL
jgi:hypothetical protein